MRVDVTLSDADLPPGVAPFLDFEESFSAEFDLFGDGGECHRCEATRDLRPFVRARPDGSAVVVDTCADCQAEIVKQTMAAGAEQTVDVDVGDGEGGDD